MKILHTSDWHLGHKLYGYDRTEEQLSFLHQLKDIVLKQQPDLMVVSGDIFHTSIPPADVQKMFVDALLDIHHVNSEMTIVVTAGNHDSYSRLEIDKNLWESHRVFIIGNIGTDKNRNADYNSHIIEVRKDGRLEGYVAAVPYCYEQNFPQVPEGVTDDRQQYFFKTLLQTIEERNTKQLPVILMAHLTVQSCDLTGHDGTIGNVEAIPLADLGAGYDYVALGHIHHAQFIHGSEHHARYSGTPIAISFDEQFEHTVTMVDIEAHHTIPQISTIEINNPHPLVTLPTEGALSFEETLTLLHDFDPNIPAYIRLNVLASPDNYISTDAPEQAVEATNGKQCRFCIINRVIQANTNDQNEIPTFSIQKIKELSTEDILNIAQNKSALSEEQMDMLRQVIQMVDESQNQ